MTTPILASVQLISLTENMSHFASLYSFWITEQTQSQWSEPGTDFLSSMGSQAHALSHSHLSEHRALMRKSQVEEPEESLPARTAILIFSSMVPESCRHAPQRGCSSCYPTTAERSHHCSIPTCPSSWLYLDTNPFPAKYLFLTKPGMFWIPGGQMYKY